MTTTQTRRSTTRSSHREDVSFDRAYARMEPAYGMQPSALLRAYLDDHVAGGIALDLGAGAGRNSLELARCGHHVRAIDLSNAGVERLEMEAKQGGLDDRIDARTEDLLAMSWCDRFYDVIVAATILDHLPPKFIDTTWEAMLDCLAPNAALYVEVHTTDDPGSPRGRGTTRHTPVSETAHYIRHYFAPNELLHMSRKRLRVMKYLERLEWDRTHGPIHQHGKAYLLATPKPNASRPNGSATPRPAVTRPISCDLMHCDAVRGHPCCPSGFR